MSQIKKVPANPEPRAFTFDEARLIVNSPTYQITDLNIYDTRGRIVFTLSVTVLHGGKQTRGHAHEIDNEIYEFSSGQGIMMLGKLAINVQAGDLVYVEKTTFHKVINTSMASDLVFRCYFTGEINRNDFK